MVCPGYLSIFEASKHATSIFPNHIYRAAAQPRVPPASFADAWPVWVMTLAEALILFSDRLMCFILFLLDLLSIM